MRYNFPVWHSLRIVYNKWIDLFLCDKVAGSSPVRVTRGVVPRYGLNRYSNMIRVGFVMCWWCVSKPWNIIERLVSLWHVNFIVGVGIYVFSNTNSISYGETEMIFTFISQDVNWNFNNQVIKRFFFSTNFFRFQFAYFSLWVLSLYVR